MRRFIPHAVTPVVLFGLLATLTTAAGPAATLSSSQTAATELDLRATLAVVADPSAPCPSGSPTSLVCPALTGQGPAPGLGMVTQTASERLQEGPPSCRVGEITLLSYPVRWGVANKGEINFVVADSAQCIAQGSSASWKQTFTITGGTGIYAGASGTGTRSQVATGSSNGFRGVETWTGTLSVPGLDFDVTAPVLTGAANKTVRAKKGAKSARVTFHVTAQDERDGALPVTCVPRSGSRYRIGRTRVACAATDGSANTQIARFTVTVTRAH